MQRMNILTFLLRSCILLFRSRPYNSAEMMTTKASVDIQKTNIMEPAFHGGEFYGCCGNESMTFQKNIEHPESVRWHTSERRGGQTDGRTKRRKIRQ